MKKRVKDSIDVLLENYGGLKDTFNYAYICGYLLALYQTDVLTLSEYENEKKRLELIKWIK